MPDLHRAAELALEELADDDRLLGAALVTRDGLPAVSRLAGPVDSDTLSAMAAAALAAAETAIMGMDTSGLRRLVAESAAMQLWIQGLDDQYILLVLGRPEVEARDIARLVDETAERIRGILA